MCPGTTEFSQQPDALASSDADFWRIGHSPRAFPHLVAIGFDEQHHDDLHDRWHHATETFPRLRQRIQGPRLGVGPPRWIPALDFRLDNHVAVRTTRSDLDPNIALAYASREFEHNFDPRQPPWRVLHLIDPAGRNATITVFHHALSDAFGMISVFDNHRRAAVSIPSPAAASAAKGILGSQLKDGLRVWRRDAVAAARGLRHRDARYDDAHGQLWHRSPSSMSRARQIVFVRGRTSHLAREAHFQNVGINEFVTGALTQSLADHLAAHGQPIDVVRVALPVSERDSDADHGGNRHRHAFFTVPVHQDGSGAWSALAAQVCRARTRNTQHDRVLLASRLLTPSLASRLLLRHFQATDLVVSSIKIPAHVVPYRLFCPIAAPVGNPVSCVIASWADTTVVGITIDRGQVVAPSSYLDLVVPRVIALFNAEVEVISSERRRMYQVS